MAHDVFVCHPSDDRATANAVVATLEADRVRCWIAPRDVLPSEEWAESIVRAIAGTKLLILVFSGHSNESRHVMREVEQAVGRAIPILPFRIEDVEPSPALEYYIGGTHWLDALTPPLEAHLKKLVETVRILLPHDVERDPADTPRTSSAEIDVDDSPKPIAPVPADETPPAPVESETDAEPRPSTGRPEPALLQDAIVETDHRELAATTPEVRPGRSTEADAAAASLAVSSAISLLDTEADDRATAEAEAADDAIVIHPATDEPPPLITLPTEPPPDGSLLSEVPKSVPYDGTALVTPEGPNVRRIGPIAISIDDQTLRIASAAAVAVLVGVVGFLGIRGLINGGDTQVLGATATTVRDGDVTDDGLAPLIPLSTSTSTTTPSTTAPPNRTTSTTSPSTTVPTTTTTITTTTTVPPATSTTVARTTTTRRTTTTTTTPVVVLVARNDSYTRTDRSQVCFDVTANDVGSGALTVISVGNSEFGSATTAGCGVLYSPPDVITRTDAFTDVISYTVKDATGATASATVTVSVR